MNRPSTYRRHWRGVLVILMLILALSACGKKDEKDKKEDAGKSSVTTTVWKSVTVTDLSTTVLAKVAATYPELTSTNDNGDVIFKGEPLAWTLSPDGTKLLAIVNVREGDPSIYTCLYTLTDESLVCRPYTSDQARLDNMPEGLIAWAPDSNHIVTHYDWMRFGQDPDLIMLEASSGLGVVVTEDRYYHNVYGDSTDPFEMDYAPFWAADSQSIYFFRVTRPTEDAWSDHVQIYNITLDGGATKLVADLSGQIDGATFGYPSHVAVSPDEHFAVIVSNDFREGNTVNVWRVDLTTGKAEVWVNQDTLYQAVVPSWMEDPGLYAPDIAWSADGKYVVLAMTYQALGARRDLATVPPLNNVIIEAATGQIHALVDVTKLTSSEVYQTQGGFYPLSPLFSLLTSDGQSLIYVTVPSTDSDILTMTFWSRPLNATADPVKMTTLDLPRSLVLGQITITDRILGTIAPNGVALVQGPRPLSPGAVELLQFAE